MRKLTKANLDELATMMPVLSEHEQRIYVGGDILINRNGVPILYSMGNNPFTPVSPFSSTNNEGIQNYALASASVPTDNGGSGSGNSGYLGSGDYTGSGDYSDSGYHGTGFYDDDVFVDGSGNRYKGYFDEDGNWVFLDDEANPNSGAVSDSTDVNGSVFLDEDSIYQPVTEDGSTTDNTTNKDKTHFTIEEYITLYEQKLWPGGYVEGLGYREGNSTDNVLKPVEVTGSFGGKTPPNDSFVLESNEDSTKHDSVPEDSTEDKNIDTPTNPIKHPQLTDIADVIPVSAFQPRDPKDPVGCQRRCKQMLDKAGVQMSGKRIYMTANNQGRAGETLPTAQDALHCINTTLERGEPIIVGVDYTSEGKNPGAEDHFIVITGRKVTVDPQTGNTIIQYHYFDPNTKYVQRGTQASNLLTLTDNRLMGQNTSTGGREPKPYTVVTVRPNL